MSVRPIRLGAHVSLEDRLVPATFYVNNDSGISTTKNSLPWAIDQANRNFNTTEVDVIDFSQMPAGQGPHTIVLRNPLTILEPLTLDGYSHPDAEPNDEEFHSNAKPMVVLKGHPTQGGMDSTSAIIVAFQAKGSSISGLAIYGCRTGISLGGSNVSIQGCFIGLNADGLTVGEGGAVPRGNKYGIEIQGNSSGQFIGIDSPASLENRNVISGNEIGINMVGGYSSRIEQIGIFGN